MSARHIVESLRGQWSGSYGMVPCPVAGHGKGNGDRNPSLKLWDGPDGVLCHCFSGCPWEAVKDELRRRGLLPEFEPGKRTDRNSGNSALMTVDYLKKPVRVTMVIEHPRKGEVAVKVRNAERFIPAVTRRPQTSFKVGDQAFIIAYRGGVAEVVSKKEFDFITYKGRGGSS